MLTLADVQPYRALMLHAYAESADAFTSTPEERAKAPPQWWMQRIAPANGLGLAVGAWQAGALVASVAVEFSDKPKTRHKGHVVGMYVRPQARGQGLARRLMLEVLAQCGQRPDLRVLNLTVTEGNAPAQQLYQSLGFASFGVEPMAIRTPEGFKGKVHMWHSLQALTPAN